MSQPSSFDSLLILSKGVLPIAPTNPSRILGECGISLADWMPLLMMRAAIVLTPSHAMSHDMKCCKSGYFHKGTPKGKTEKVAGIESYVTGSSDASAAIVIVTDVFGLDLNNVKVLADKYAESVGAYVVVPDQFNNDAAPLDALSNPNSGFSVPDFIGKHNPRDTSLTEKVVKELKQKYKKIGTMGFCWGAPGSLAMAHADGLADAVAFAHPSLTETSDFEKLKKPMLGIRSEHDFIFTDDKVAEALEATKKLAKDGQFIKWSLYLNTTHGFAARGDEEDGQTALAMGQAFHEVVGFFKAFL